MGIKIVEGKGINAFMLKDLQDGSLAIIISGEHIGSIVTMVGTAAILIEEGTIFCPDNKTFVRPLEKGERLEIT